MLLPIPRWWDAGCRSLKDVSDRQRQQPGWLSPRLAWVVQHRQDLVGDVQEGEVEEMKEVRRVLCVCMHIFT